MRNLFDSWIRPVAFALAMCSACYQAPGQSRPTLEVPRLQNGAFQFRVTGDARQEIRVERSAALPSWNDWLRTNLSAAGSLDLADSVPPSEAARFYRVTTISTASNTVAPLEFVEPIELGVITNRRPEMALRWLGTVGPVSNLVLRANGLRVPARFAYGAGGLVVCALDADLPEGKVFLTAGTPYQLGKRRTLATRRIVVRVPGGSTAPVARDDDLITVADQPVTIEPLANDWLAPETSGALPEAEAAQHGTVRQDGPRLIYEPAPGFVGHDSFTYRIRAGQETNAQATVRVWVRETVGRIAYVVDAPVLANEFRTLEEALAYLCQVAAGAERGKAVIRTRRPLPITTLSIRCRVDIEAEEDGVILEANAMVIDCAVATSFIGIRFNAPGGVTFNVRTDLDLLRDSFVGPASIKLLGPAMTLAGLRAAGGGSEHHVHFERNLFDTLHLTGEAGGNSELSVEGGSGRSVVLDGTWSGNATGRIENTIATEEVRVVTVLEGSARTTSRNLVDIGAFGHDAEVKGQHAISVDTVVSAETRVNVKGVGEGRIALRGSRTDDLSMRLGSKKISHEAKDNYYGRANWRFEGAEGASVEAVVTEDRAQVGGAATLFVAEGAKVDSTVRYSLFDDTFELETKGQFRSKFQNGTVFGAEARFLARGELMEIELKEVNAEGEFYLEAIAGVRTGLKASNTLFKDDVGMRLDPTVTATIAVDDVTVARGATWVIDQIGNLINQSPRIGRRPGAALLGIGSANSVEMRNLKFQGTPAQPGPRLALYGVRAPIVIEKCEFFGDGNLALVVTEPQASVTIRTSIFKNGGIGCDGDVEGEGRSGLSPGPLVLEGNQLQSGLVPAVVLQDFRQAALVANTVTGKSGVSLTSGGYLMSGNRVELELGLGSGVSLPGGIGGGQIPGGIGLPGAGSEAGGGALGGNSIAVIIGNGPNGPATLRATNNWLQATTVLNTLNPAYLWFEGNTIVSGFMSPPDPEEPDAETELVPGSMILGGQSGILSAVFRENSFSNIAFRVLGGIWARIDRNQFQGVGSVGVVPGLASTGQATMYLVDNTFPDDSEITFATAGYAEIRGNRLGENSKIGAGGLAPSLTLVEDNRFGPGGTVQSGVSGFMRSRGNSLPDGSLVDQGFHLNDPGANAVENESIQSPLDFNNNGCRDYPRPDLDEEGECANGSGPPPPEPPSIAPSSEPLWPVF